MLPTFLVGNVAVDVTPNAYLNPDAGYWRLDPMSEALLRDIAEYCRGAGIAESTFGRLAVNDGKRVGRLRLGGRVTTDTVERVRAFITREPHPAVNGVPVAMPVPLSPPTAEA